MTLEIKLKKRSLEEKESYYLLKILDQAKALKEANERVDELEVCVDLLHKKMWAVLDDKMKFKDAKCLANCVRAVLDATKQALQDKQE